MSTANAQDGPRTNIVIIGAGVIGCTIAHVLSGNSNYKITIVARDLPGDLDSQAYASPWAGANWSPIGGFNDRIHKWETATFNEFWRMREQTDSTGNRLVRDLAAKVLYTHDKAVSRIWYKDLIKDFRILDQADLANFSGLPSPIKEGAAFTTISVNPEYYLPWLKSELDKQGVAFVRKKLGSLDDALDQTDGTDIVINATGLGARSLLGVEDQAVVPIRGQAIIVHAPALYQECVMVLDEVYSDTGDSTYIIPRSCPPGSVLLGGTFQKNNWDTSVSPQTAAGILERCAILAPALKETETRIMSHNVGLRPARIGGPRVEAERVARGSSRVAEALPWRSHVQDEVDKFLVIHAYGFGAAGYQNSWGVAEEVAQLIRSESRQ